MSRLLVALVFSVFILGLTAAPANSDVTKNRHCTVNFFVDLARICGRPGADSVCIKNWDTELLEATFDHCCKRTCDDKYLSRLCCGSELPPSKH
uniref:DB domain-containing protein n=1 Tax=Steinernema glaseri TaxID=37863 RepID=A0A1I7YIA2_9BILA